MVTWKKKFGRREGEQIGLPAHRHRLAADGDGHVARAVERGRRQAVEIVHRPGDARLQFREGRLSVGKLGFSAPVSRAPQPLAESLARWIWPASVSMSGASRAFQRSASSRPFAFACSTALSRIADRLPKARTKTGTETSWMERDKVQLRDGVEGRVAPWTSDRAGKVQRGLRHATSSLQSAMADCGGATEAASKEARPRWPPSAPASFEARRARPRACQRQDPWARAPG